MKSIFFGGLAGSGKTAVALGLALKLRESGLKISYFKPVCTARTTGKETDGDVLLFSSVFRLPHEASVLSPVKIGPFYQSGGAALDPAPLAERIRLAYVQVSQNTDAVIIEGSASPYHAASLGLDTAGLCRMLGSPLVYLNRPEDDFSLDQSILYNRFLRLADVRVLGTIFNNVERTLLDKVRGVYAPILEGLGCRMLGIIPQRAETAAPTAAEFYEALGGELLAGQDYLHRLVEETVVGSMTIESALKYLRRAPNKAVITGGDRSDMALMALESGTSVLILTGGLYPDVGVLSRANEKKIPVILVPFDTFTTIDKLHDVSRRLRPSDEQSILLAQENIEQYCQWRELLSHFTG